MAVRIRYDHSSRFSFGDGHCMGFTTCRRFRTTLNGSASAPAEPYYGFYSSPLGPSYKTLRHNLFGFQIDLPSNWNFGVITQGDIPVALLYPSSVETTRLSDSYISIEIGSLALPKMTLEEAHRHLMTGMQTADPGLHEIELPATNQSSGRCGASIAIHLAMKTQVEVVEWVTLVEEPKGIRSVTVRGA